MALINLIKIRKHEAEYLRSKGVFVPQYNKDHKQKYLMVESNYNKELLKKYREKIVKEVHE